MYTTNSGKLCTTIIRQPNTIFIATGLEHVEDCRVVTFWNSYGAVSFLHC